MELRQLRYFIAVAEQGSIAAASRILHIAQPALSRQICALEVEMECALFERMPRGVRMTRAGQEFDERAREVLKQVGNVKLRVASAASGGIGLLRIGVMPGYSGLGVLSNTIQRMGKSSPGVRIAIESTLSIDQFRAIKEGEIDVGLVAWRPPLDSALKGELVYQETMLVALPASVAAAHPRLTKLRQLSDQSFLIFPRERSPSHYDLLMQAFNASGVSVGGPVVNDVPTILGLVSAGIGCGVVGASYRDHCPKNVVLRRVSGLDITLNIEMVYRADNQDPILAGFLDIARRTYLQRHGVAHQNFDAVTP